MDCVVAPLDQMLLLAEEEVSVTLPAGHKVTGPAGEIVGVAKDAAMVTVMELDASGGQTPTVFVTEYVPPLVTVMEGVVAPFDQVMSEVTLEVKTTDPPAQNEVGPPAVITGVWLAVIVIPEDCGDVQPASVKVTV